MNKKQLSIICAETVVNSKLPKEAKLQMLTFIKEEASEVQLKSLLLDGKIIPQVDEITEQIINDRFNNVIQEGLLKTLFGMVILTPAGWVMYRLIRAAFSSASRKCGTFAVGKARDICFLRVKITRNMKMINLLQKSLANCGQSKKPDKCKAKAQEKIGNYKLEIKELEGRVNDIQKSGPKATIQKQEA